MSGGDRDWQDEAQRRLKEQEVLLLDEVTSGRLHVQTMATDRMEVRSPVLSLALPRARSVLVIGTTLRIESEKPQPNWWWRFWAWVLLGWEWRAL